MRGIRQVLNDLAQYDDLTRSLETQYKRRQGLQIDMEKMAAELQQVRPPY